MLYFMGIDPGLVNTGLAIIEWVGINKFNCVSYKLISPPTSLSLPLRLGYISEKLYSEAKLFKLHSAAVEGVFYSVNAKSALLLGQARGAIIATLSIMKIPVLEYSALQIKQAITGYGRATKDQVKKMVGLHLSSDFSNQKFDVTDAIACGLCLAMTQTLVLR